MKQTTIGLVLFVLTAFLFNYFGEFVPNNKVDPYEEILKTNNIDKYNQSVWFEEERLYARRHPADYPAYHSKIFDFIPVKKESEYRIVFIGNSQLFQVIEKNQVPLPLEFENQIKNLKTENIRVFNLSGQGMSTTELFIYTIKSIKINPDLIIIAFTPRDYVNENIKSIGIIPEYSKALLEPHVIKSLAVEHFNSLNYSNGKKLLTLNSLTQYFKATERELNTKIENNISFIYPKYYYGKYIKDELEKTIFQFLKMESILVKIADSQIMTPSKDKPYYEQEQFPNVRTSQAVLTLHFLKKNYEGRVVVYNEPIRPSTFDFYFDKKSYDQKVNDLNNICRNLDFQFYDFHSQLEDTDFADWIHLSTKGTKKLSTLLVKNIRTIIDN